MVYNEPRDPMTGKATRHASKSLASVMGLNKSIIEPESIEPEYEPESEHVVSNNENDKWLMVTSGKSVKQSFLNPKLMKILKIDDKGILFESVHYKTLQDLYSDELKNESSKRGFHEKYGIRWWKFMDYLSSAIIEH